MIAEMSDTQIPSQDWPFHATWRAGAMDSPLLALARAVEACPDDRFLDICGESCTFGEFDRQTTRLAHSLRQLGVEAGETVISFTDTALAPVLLWFAANKIGAIWVPVNTAHRGTFLSHQVNNAGGRVMLCGADLLDRVRDVLPELDAIRTILVAGDCAAETVANVMIAPFDDHRGEDETPIDRPVDPKAISCLIFTSGTTGPSKACMISHNQIAHFGWRHLEAAPQRKGDVAWSCLPIFHTGAIVSVIMSALLSQAPGTLTARFSVSNFWYDVERTGATITFILATMWPLLAEAADNDAMKRCFGQLKIITGVPVTPPVRKIFHERFGVGYINSYNYGQTECCKLGHVDFGRALPAEGSAGFVADMDYEVIIADDDDRELPRGQVGEILYRPKRPHIMFEGYWRRPDATQAAWTNLWMHSGDLGRIDENDVLWFVDRKKDYLRRGGENVSSWELEAAFKRHPDLEDVAIHAVLSDLSEDEIKLTCVPREGVTLTEEALLRWSIGQLPRFAVPRYVEFRAVLPKTPTGRVQKYQLREEGCTPATWDRVQAGIEIPR